MHWILNSALRFLSHDWAGLVIAACMFAVAILLYLLLKRPWLAMLVGGVGILLAIGAGVHLVQARALARSNPPPGKIVEIGGSSLHILAEGSGSGPVFVSFGGAHAPGASIMHLHRSLRTNHRSILIDRPGTGWSGPAPFPLSTALEADMMWQLLDKSGEKGPFVLAGHSFGGLLAANMARRRPGQVHALVLLDPTPPDVIVYGPLLGDLSAMRTEPFWRGLFALFGIDYDPGAGKPVPPAYRRIEEIVKRQLGKDGEIMRAQGGLPRSHMAATSIYRELSPRGMAEAGWQTALFDGELDGTRVYLVAPQTQLGVELLPEVQNADQREALRMQRFFGSARERAMAFSDKSVRVVAPPETGHNFVYEEPAFTLAAMRAAAQ